MTPRSRRCPFDQTGTTALLALLAACAPSAESPGASMPRLVRRILLSVDGSAAPRGRIDHLDFDPATRRLFVACVEADMLAVVELEGATPVRLLGGLRGPQGVAVVPGSKDHAARVFIACGGDGKVHAFDATSLLELGSVFAGEDADNVRFDARSRRLHVGCGSEQGGAIVAIDPDALTVTGRTLLPAHAEGFQLDPDSSRMFINVPGAKEAAGNGSVLVADRDRFTITATWPLERGSRNFPLAWLPRQQLVFTACRQPPVLIALDADDGRELGRAPCTGDCDDVFFDPANGTVLAVGGGVEQGGLDVFTFSIDGGVRPLGTLPLPPRARTGLLVPERRALYVAVPALHEGELAAILEFAVD